ncbi:MAG: hypothetical protein JSW50_14500 [Candidatus Latescibacterota bacterium]|nr:MAG: hypothetical protein JSW50_14500 [Candidatus Latescibacterota bacterium]
MRRTAFLSLILVFCASFAFAQAGAVNLFADPGGSTCDLVPVVGGLWSVYAVHVLSPGATASQWSAPVPACALPGGLWLSDTAVYPVTVGNSQTGVAIGYGVCVPSPNHILTINLFVQAPIAPCCVWPILPDPNVPSGKVEVVDCANNLLQVDSQASAVINSDPSCDCFEPLPTETSTWGKVKALYSQ